MTGQGLLVREATIDDAPTITQFVVAMAADSEGIELDLNTVEAAVRAVLQDRSKGVYYVAETEDGLVGQALVTTEWSDWNCSEYWWLQSVYVHPDRRRSGIFTAIYRHIERAARDAGAAALRLYVARDNTPARVAYERVGMSESPYLVYERGIDEPETP